MEKNAFSINSSLPEINKVNDSFDEWLSVKLNGMLSQENKSVFIEEFKVVTYELFSNCIIHNESAKINYEIKYFKNKVELTVFIKGKGFRINPLFDNDNGAFYCPPYPPELINKLITVYVGIDYKVDCLIVDPNQIEFKYFQTEESAFNIDLLPEHFGLYLISSLTDSFVYKRIGEETDSYEISKLIK